MPSASAKELSTLPDFRGDVQAACYLLRNSFLFFVFCFNTTNRDSQPYCFYKRPKGITDFSYRQFPGLQGHRSYCNYYVTRELLVGWTYSSIQGIIVWPSLRSADGSPGPLCLVEVFTVAHVSYTPPN